MNPHRKTLYRPSKIINFPGSPIKNPEEPEKIICYEGLREEVSVPYGKSFLSDAFGAPFSKGTA